MPAVRSGARPDALIVGGGLAGLAAALWLRDFGLSALILEESDRPGGQLHEIHAPVPNYPAAVGWSGPRLAARILEDARAAELQILVGAPVTRVSARGRWADRGEERFRGRTLLIATGLRRRSLGVPGERELLGRGVSHSANRDRALYAAQPVAVVGGGTAAVEDALLLAEAGCRVTLLHRTARFRARPDFLARARADARIRILSGARVTRIAGGDRVEGLECRVRGSAGVRRVEARAVFVRIGWEPRTELLRGQVRLDREGYIRTGAGGVTGARGVFAAGDVCSPRWPSLANAAGQGAVCAWEIARLLGRLPR